MTSFKQIDANRRDTSVKPASVPAADLAGCFLHLANLPNYTLDCLSRYEATLWRQVGQILFALDTLDRRKSQERRPASLWRNCKTHRSASAVSADPAVPPKR
jgi:hypothetical protein